MGHVDTSPPAAGDPDLLPRGAVETVAFTLEPLGSGTLVKLTESGYSASERDAKAHVGCAVGWGEALTLLKFYLEHGLIYGHVPSAR